MALNALNACNAEHGIFFSRNAYDPFFEYRKRLINIVKKAKMGESINQIDVFNLMEISTKGIGDMK